MSAFDGNSVALAMDELVNVAAAYKSRRDRSRVLSLGPDSPLRQAMVECAQELIAADKAEPREPRELHESASS